MIFNSRVVALLLSFCIALIITAFQSLVEEISYFNLSGVFLISFFSSFLLIYVTLEFLIFKEIKNIYSVLNSLKNGDLSGNEGANKSVGNPLKRINQEIFSYAADKQREINDLKKLEIFRREFLADVAHELKTPIFAAQGFVHTLLDGAAEEKYTRYKFLKKAAKSLDGLDMLVQDLLTISKMETGEIKMQYEHFNIAETIRDVFEQFDGEAEKKDITLNRSDDMAAPIYVYADEQRIYQVMVNLVSNAIKYTKKEGEVYVSLNYESDFVNINVTDNGKGISQKDKKRIFERFYRIEKSRSKNKGGTGLGLAIVKHIIEAHQSKVNVTSTVGKGSTFSFKLPKGHPKEQNNIKNLEEVH